MESLASTVMILPLMRMRSEDDEDCARHATGRAKAAIEKNIGVTSRTNRAKRNLIGAPLNRVRKRIALDE